MARTSVMWWPWVQRQLNARRWRPADLAREIRKRGGGPDESVIGRWKNRGSQPTRESVRIVAEVFHRDVREALVAAGLATAKEMAAPWGNPLGLDLMTVPDEALAEEVLARESLAEEVLARLARRGLRQHQPVAASIGAATGRTTIPTSSSASSRHTVPTDTEPAPPTSEEDEGAEVDAHCA